MNNNTLRGLTTPRSQYAEIKRRAAKKLANRAAAPNNWTGLTNAQIANLLKFNIGAWRSAAYLRGIAPRGLAPATGIAENTPHSKYYKGRIVAMYHSIPPSSNKHKGPRVKSTELTYGNQYKNSGGVGTAAGKALGYFGPVHMGGRIKNTKNWIAGHVRRHLAKKVPKPPPAILSANINAQVLGVGNQSSNKKIRMHVSRQSNRHNWVIKNRNKYEKNYNVFFAGGNSVPIVFLASRKQ